MRLVSIILILLILLSFDNDNKTQSHKVKPLKGESIPGLLKRFHLDAYPCDTRQFLKLNKLKRNSPLLADREYILPVDIFKYNGKSIRTTVGTKDFDKAKRIQTYNELLSKKQLRRSSYRDSKILWVPYHELHCSDDDEYDAQNEIEAKPSLSASEKKELSKRKFPIFGHKNAQVANVNNKLKGHVYYIESGHGGPDPGAVTKVNNRSICEDEYAYDVALRVSRWLIERGATVYIINRDPNDGIRNSQLFSCDCDEQTYPDLSIPRNQKKRLFQRSDAINSLYEKNKKQGVKDQRTLIIHVESRGKREQTDLFFYYHPDSKPSKKLASKMHKLMERKYTHRDYQGSVTKRDLHMLRECKPTTVFVELGNIRNSFDQQRIIKPNNRQAIANWLAEGLIE